MNKFNFRSINRLFILTAIMLLQVIVFTSCSSDDADEARTYNIGISTISVSSSSMSYLTMLTEAEKKYDKSFTITDSKDTSDKQAKAKFAVAMVAVHAAAATVTDCSGYVIYELTCGEDIIASEKIEFKK